MFSHTKPSVAQVRLNNDVAARVFSPQTDQIARHMLQHGSISGVEAAAMFKTRSLSRRIRDIRARAVTIRSDYRKDTTGQRYVRYVLE